MFLNKRYKKQPRDYYYQGYYNLRSWRRFFYQKKFDYILEKIKQVGARDILDLGCGNGIFIKLAQERGLKAFGVDNNWEFLWVARKLVGKENIKKADIRSINLKKTFEIITCLDVLEHFSMDDLVRVFFQMQLHLKDSGYLFITFPTSLYLKITEPLWKMLRFCIYGKRNFVDRDIHHLLKVENIQEIAQKNHLILKERKTIVWGLLHWMILQKNETL